MRKRSGTARAALLGNGMAWFGGAAFLLGLAGEHVDALTSGSWERAVGFSMILVVGVTLVLAGVLDNRRIRTGRRRLD
jgi:hypothetical protein